VTSDSSQTLSLTDTITLCDCPGLVFPSFMTVRADMVLNGVLPIDQLRDHVGECAAFHFVPANTWVPALWGFSCVLSACVVTPAPMALLCQRLSRQQLEAAYRMSCLQSAVGRGVIDWGFLVLLSSRSHFNCKATHR